MCTINNKIPSLAEMVKKASAGTGKDIDCLMKELLNNNSFVTCKIIDHALGQVISMKGRKRIKQYLFHGARIQRNYAALYFKRRGIMHLLDKAVELGRIDEKQAYSK